MVTCDLGMGVGPSCFLQKFDSPYIDYQVSRNSTRKDKKKYYKSFTSIISNIYRARDGDCISFIIQKQNQYFHVSFKSGFCYTFFWRYKKKNFVVAYKAT